MKNNVIKLEDYLIAEKKSNSLTQVGAIVNLFLNALGILEFEPIPKNTIEDGNDYDNSEFYIGDDGEVLLGRMVHISDEFFGAGLDGTIELMKEIYLAEEGRFLVFLASTEYDKCNSKGRWRTHRIIAADQSISFEEIIGILNEISMELTEDPLFLE